MKRVIISGATSMLGSELVRRYNILEPDTEVIGLVRKKTEKLSNLDGLKVQQVECDLGKTESLLKIVSKADVFYHFAWDGTYGNARADRKRQMKNVDYIGDMLELAKSIGCRKFVGAGSQAEFGGYQIPLSDSLEKHPETEYGKAKLAAWNKILENSFGIEVNWGRVLSAYGPGDNHYTMVMSTLQKMIKGDHCGFTQARQMWEYTYSADVAKAFYLIGEKGIDKKAYTIGSGEVLPLAEYISYMAQAVEERFERKVDYSLGEIPYYPNQVMHLSADISELVKDTDYIAEVFFKEGIRRVLEFLDK